MKSIDICKKTATSLEELVQLIRQETEIVLTEGATPVARVISMAESQKPIEESRPSQPRELGLHPGAIVASEDFDEPLPDEFWLGKE